MDSSEVHDTHASQTQSFSRWQLHDTIATNPLVSGTNIPHKPLSKSLRGGDDAGDRRKFAEHDWKM